MEALSILYLSGSLFLFTLIFGFWLSKVGKPYHGVLFNTHKLLALGAVIATVILVFRIFKSVDPVALVLILLGIAALCVGALFASGALMSAEKLDYLLMRRIHRITPIVLVFVLAWVTYLIWKVE